MTGNMSRFTVEGSLRLKPKPLLPILVILCESAGGRGRHVQALDITQKLIGVFVCAITRNRAFDDCVPVAVELVAEVIVVCWTAVEGHSQLGGLEGGLGGGCCCRHVDIFTSCLDAGLSGVAS